MYWLESLNLLPVANGLGKDNVVSTDGKLGELRDYYVSPDKRGTSQPRLPIPQLHLGTALPACLPAKRILYTSSSSDSNYCVCMHVCVCVCMKVLFFRFKQKIIKGV